MGVVWLRLTPKHPSSEYMLLTNESTIRCNNIKEWTTFCVPNVRNVAKESERRRFQAVSKLEKNK